MGDVPTPTSTLEANAYGQKLGAVLKDWQGAKSPGRPILKGRYCTLERLDVSKHGSDLAEAYLRPPDDRNWTYLLNERPADKEGMLELFKAQIASEPLNHFFAVLGSRNGLEGGVHDQVQGSLALSRVDEANGNIEVAHVNLGPDLQRTRAATETFYLAIRYAFEDLGHRRVEWKCHWQHEKSRAAALRLGFSFEGIFRNHYVVKGRARDTAWFGMTCDEWPEKRRRLEEWLDPSNFDVEGKQRKRLG